MKTSKHAIALTLTGLLSSFNLTAHADTAARIKGGDFSDLSSSIPLVIFIVAAIFVYLCNRPRRVVVYARARRRSDSSRDTTH